MRAVLTDTARYLRVIVEQVLARMNAGRTPEAIFHAVEPDPVLATRPYLRARYDHPKFIVRNLLRLWGGWWDGNAANLLPATWEAQAREIATLAGGVEAVVARGRRLLEAGDLALAAHLAEWATRAAPEDLEAQHLERDVYARRLEEAEAVMAQGIFRAAMNERGRRWARHRSGRRARSPSDLGPGERGPGWPPRRRDPSTASSHGPMTISFPGRWPPSAPASPRRWPAAAWRRTPPCSTPAAAAAATRWSWRVSATA